jgi:integrase/recombinase XerC
MNDAKDLLEQYLRYCEVEKRLSPRTLAIYRHALDQLQAVCTELGLGPLALKSAHVRRWVGQLRTAGRKSNGIALCLSGWRGFYRWAGQQGYLVADPTADVRAPKRARPLPKALGVDQAQQLADFVPDAASDPWLSARDKAMVELLYGCGLRVSELTGLDRVARSQSKGWLDLDEGMAYVTGKGSKRRSVPLGPPAIAAVRAWLALAPPRFGADLMELSPLFSGQNGTRLTAQSIWARLRRWGQQAGLAGAVHPHMLRHSFASHILQSSGDLRAVQELLGHANIATTQVYTRLDFQHLSASYDKAHPRAKRGDSRP